MATNGDPPKEDTFRASLVTLHAKSSDAYDKAVTTLAGGALAISVTFVHDIAPDPQNTEWLSRSWILFAASLALIFLSFLSSQYAISRRIKEWDEDKVFKFDVWLWITVALNLLSGASFIAGITCLLTFATFNI